MNTSRRYHAWRKLKNFIMSGLSLVCAVVVIAPLALILFYLIKSGASAIDWHFLTQSSQTGRRSGWWDG